MRRHDKCSKRGQTVVCWRPGGVNGIILKCQAGEYPPAWPHLSEGSEHLSCPHLQ